MAHAVENTGETMDEEMSNWSATVRIEEIQSSRKRTGSFLDIAGELSLPEVHNERHDNIPATTPEQLVQQEPVVDCLLGSILNVNAQLSRNHDYPFPEAPSSQLFAEGVSVVPLQVTRSGDFLELIYEGYKCAGLNKDFCKEICALWDEHIELRAFIDYSTWPSLHKAWNSVGWQSEPTVFEVEVNLYSARCNADKIGRILSKAGIYLQTPIFLHSGISHYNPQILALKDFTPNPRAIEDTDDRNLEHPNSAQAAVQSGTRSRRRRQDALDEVLDSLSHNDIEHEIRADDSRILKSELLPHQQKAIDFILQRESGNVTSDLTMWKENNEDADETFYQHVLTGAKRPRRDEVLGGIVADDMGLGKSLVMLSTIAASSDRAKSFVDHENTLDETSRNTERTLSRATLILAPSTLLIDSWVDELRRHVYPGGLKFFKYLGPERHAEQQALFDNDIVFSTYATVAKEKTNEQSPLKRILWYRLVLDEAHEIRNRSTRQYEAVYALPAQHRWCLTGTPIQNTLEDLGSLVSFLRVPILENNPTFRKFIVNPTVPGYASGFQNLQTLLRTVCIRRTRESLGLPDPEPEIRSVHFSPQERIAYDKLWDKFRHDIQMAVSGRKARVSSTALECIHELRLFCNNGPRRNAATWISDPTETDDERLSKLEQRGRNKCAICSTTVLSIDRQDEGNGGIFMPSCDHLVCHICAPQANIRSEICPFCEKDPPASDPQIGASHSQDNPVPQSEPLQYPSKLQALLSDISQDTNRKCIVFSSWKKTLDIAAKMMQARGFRYDIIHGGLTLKKRINVLNGFKSPTGPNILLMTLGTGAVGLNLAVASRIYLLEPQWNPFLELQAMARALRIGQDHQVTIIRFIMAKTIEQSNVLNRQKTKTRLAGGGFGRDKVKDSLSYFNLDPDRIVRDDSEVELSSTSDTDEITDHQGGVDFSQTTEYF